jgi:hypothetical protein
MSASDAISPANRIIVFVFENTQIYLFRTFFGRSCIIVIISFGITDVVVLRHDVCQLPLPVEFGHWVTTLVRLVIDRVSLGPEPLH